MNNEHNNKSPIGNAEKLKEIPKWTRRYAQNRMLTAFVLMVMICLYSVVITPPVMCLVIGFHKGNMMLAGVGIALLVPILIFYIIFLSKFGGKNRGLIDQKIDQWIYGREGMTSMAMPEATKKKKWLDLILGAIGFICMLGSMYLTMEGFMAFKYLQPLSALYVVPLFVFQYFLQRPKVGPLVLICPILYTIHAILIVAGVPIFFTGGLCMLSIVLPFFGYTFLAYVIGHMYSRYALKKLRTTAHLQENSNVR